MTLSLLAQETHQPGRPRAPIPWSQPRCSSTPYGRWRLLTTGTTNHSVPPYYLGRWKARHRRTLRNLRSIMFVNIAIIEMEVAPLNCLFLASLQSQTIVPQIRLRLPSRENGTVISSRDQADNGLEVPEGDGDATTDPSLMSSSVPLRTSDPLWALRQRRLSSVSTTPSAVSSDLPSPPGSPPHSALSPLAVFEAPNAEYEAQL